MPVFRVEYPILILLLSAVLLGCSQPPSQKDTLSPQTNTTQTEFDQIVESLDTPQKLRDFMKKYFSIEERGGCTAYEPQKFFELRKGDCKDYSAFSSLVLSRHGYNAQMLCFDLYSSEGVRTTGHVVTVFKVNGELKYMSLHHIEPASSVQDVLESERDRLGYSRIGDYETVPAGSTYICPQYNPTGR
ncbi:MAG: transglutaminase-like domain-containing protein [Archaeoglobaceae archaeon]